MGNSDTKHVYRKAVVDLTSRKEPIDPGDEEFWSQFWHHNHAGSIQDVFAVLTPQEIRNLREESPSNLATFCFKAVEQLARTTDTLCNTPNQQKTVLTCVALLSRLLPYIFEESDWRHFFWSNPSSTGRQESPPISNNFEAIFTNRCLTRAAQRSVSQLRDEMHDFLGSMPLAQSLLLALTDLLFCPDFTVAPLEAKGTKFGAPDTPPEDLQSIDSCEYIWEAGVGCSVGSPSNSVYDFNRTEILRLLLICFSESMYCSAVEVGQSANRWIEFFTSSQNRHALPLFTSLLNTVFAYNPNSMLPFNHFFFSDSKEPLVEVALQVLIVCLDHDYSLVGNDIDAATMAALPSSVFKTPPSMKYNPCSSLDVDDDPVVGGADDVVVQSGPATSIGCENLFRNYISRIHREDDFEFILKGFTRLLNNPLQQSYLPNSAKHVHFHQELLVLFWKICDYNKKFMYYVLKTCDVLKIIVPILYHLNDARADRSRVGLVHIGVFIILLLSGERNFGVRLNRPYQASVPMDLPIFSGTHADLLVIVFHKLITTGHQRLQPLFDCLLTILVNVSPYLKTLSMVASIKILQLLEAFSTPWFLFSNQTNHHLVFFLLEIFNNIIQYQFDGNSNLIYTIIRKRNVFHCLANLPTDMSTIEKSMNQSSIGGSTSSLLTSGKRTKTSNSRRTARPLSLFETTSKAQPAQNEHEYPHSQVMLNQHQVHSKSIPTSPIDSKPLGPTPEDALFFDLHTVEPPNVNVSLAAMPELDLMTEKTHPVVSDASMSGSNSQATIINTATPSVGTSEETCEFEPSTTPTPIQTHIKRGSVYESIERESRRKGVSRQSSSGSTGHSQSGLGRTSANLPSTAAAVVHSTWSPSSEWIVSWKQKLPLQTIMRMLQVLVPQVEKMCIDKGITDENEILKFLQHGTLVGLLPVPHPILIRKYQTNIGTTIWFRTYMWGVIYLRNCDPPIWYDTNVKLFEIQKN